jgi:hypothetical protein
MEWDEMRIRLLQEMVTGLLPNVTLRPIVRG